MAGSRRSKSYGWIRQCEGQIPTDKAGDAGKGESQRPCKKGIRTLAQLCVKY